MFIYSKYYMIDMEIKAKVQLNNLIRLREDHLTWINSQIGDEIIIVDQEGKKGKFLALYKNGE